eukprot:COSAG04_NODE_173_length_21572_cov_104.574256_8_plen_53_part_00
MRHSGKTGLWSFLVDYGEELGGQFEVDLTPDGSGTEFWRPKPQVDSRVTVED